jgi:hypothetical protein
MTLYCAGYGFTLTGLRANGCGSVMLRAHVRSIVRTGVAEGMVNGVVPTWAVESLEKRDLVERQL